MFFKGLLLEYPAGLSCLLADWLEDASEDELRSTDDEMVELLQKKTWYDFSSESMT